MRGVKTAEQRKDLRVPLRLEVQWNRSSHKDPDVTSDLSLGGCFIETLDEVSVGEVLNLGLRFSSNVILPVWGEVRYYHPTIGFGIRFMKLSTFQRDKLKVLIARHGREFFSRQALNAPMRVYTSIQTLR